MEIVIKVEYIYEDTRSTTKVEPDYKWGEIYRMISNQNVTNAGFEELTIYANIEKSTLITGASLVGQYPIMLVHIVGFKIIKNQTNIL